MPESIGVYLLDDPALDCLFGLVVQVHVADHPLKLIGGENVPKDVEDLAGLARIQVMLDLLDPLEELLHDAPFARVGCHEIEDETVFLLAVAMDAAHALFQSDWVPWNVVVDHEPAELKVDSFTCGLCGHKHLCAVPISEGTLRVKTRAGRVAVSDLHAAVDLRDGKPHCVSLETR